MHNNIEVLLCCNMCGLQFLYFLFMLEALKGVRQSDTNG